MSRVESARCCCLLSDYYWNLLDQTGEFAVTGREVLKWLLEGNRKYLEGESRDQRPKEKGTALLIHRAPWRRFFVVPIQECLPNRYSVQALGRSS